MPEPSRRAVEVLETPPLVFRVPCPPSDLSPNMERNLHWTKKREAVKAYKELGRWHCLAAMQSKGFKTSQKVRVSYVWHKGKKRGTGFYRPKDDRNAIASLKALDDGMVLAGLVPDDSAKYWEFGGLTFVEGDDTIVVTVEVLG